MQDSAIAIFKGPAEAPKELLNRMDDEIARIVQVVCDALLQEAQAQGSGAQIQRWLAQHAEEIRLSALLFTRHAMLAPMGPDEATTIAKSARATYLYTLNLVHNQIARFPPGFGNWLEQHKDFLLALATSLIVSLDVKSSTDKPDGKQLPPKRTRKRAPSRARIRAAAVELIADLLRKGQPATSSTPTERPKPRTYPDSLAYLMRDKVQLLHMLAEYQYEQGEDITGAFLEPLCEATIAAAALNAAQEARREFYFRPHDTFAALGLNWVIEDQRLDATSEDALYGEVLDDIERLKEAVAKVKPKRKRW